MKRIAGVLLIFGLAACSKHEQVEDRHDREAPSSSPSNPSI
jgi:hypothetical protein